MPNYAKLAVHSALSVFGIRSQYEQPRYEVMEYVGSVEIRAYGKRLAAEATFTVPDEAGGREQAFKILAAYIFGQNRTAEGVAPGAGAAQPMAAGGPGETTADPPVATREIATGRSVMRFFLPGELTIATAPKPLDARVRL